MGEGAGTDRPVSEPPEKGAGTREEWKELELGVEGARARGR